MIKIAGEMNWMGQFEFQVLWCGSGRAVGPCISSECVSWSTQECWEGSELEFVTMKTRQQSTRQHFHTICSWLCEGVSGSCFDCQTVHYQLVLFAPQNLGVWVSTNGNQHPLNNNELSEVKSQFFPSTPVQVTSILTKTTKSQHVLAQK